MAAGSRLSPAAGASSSSSSSGEDARPVTGTVLALVDLKPHLTYEF